MGTGNIVDGMTSLALAFDTVHEVRGRSEHVGKDVVEKLSLVCKCHSGNLQSTDS